MKGAVADCPCHPEGSLVWVQSKVKSRPSNQKKCFHEAIVLIAYLWIMHFIFFCKFVSCKWTNNRNLLKIHKWLDKAIENYVSKFHIRVIHRLRYTRTPIFQAARLEFYYWKQLRERGSLEDLFRIRNFFFNIKNDMCIWKRYVYFVFYNKLEKVQCFRFIWNAM